MGKFSDKVVFITGSSKGIGRAIAEAMLQQGARVVLNGRNSELLEKTATALSGPGRELLQIAADVSQPEAFSSALDLILARFGKLDILILNAGLSSYGAVEKTSDTSLEQVMRVNTLGPFAGTRIALPHILASRGSIVYISSLAGLHGIPYSSVYSMSKMSLTALAESLKTELTGKGVHIGIVYVGFTRNDPTKTAVAPDGTIRPLQDRPGWVQQSPEKVARLILRSIRRRRFRTTLSTMGRLMAFFSRYFPRLFQFSMRGMLKSAQKLTAED
jgi:short-subunit dehydrogenase